MQRKKPWRNMGVAIDGAKTASDAMKQAGLNYTVELAPMHLVSSRKIDGIPIVGKKIPRQRAVIKSGTSDVLGIVSKSYQPIQNSEVFGFCDHLVEEGQATFRCAGQLPNGGFAYGSRVFLAAQLGDNFNIGGDAISKWMFLRTGHDGGMGLIGELYAYRQICTNGMMGLDRKASFNIRHSKNYQDGIRQGRMILGTAEVYYRQLEETFNKLLDAPYSTGEMTNLAEAIVPVSEKDKKENHVGPKTKKKREKIVNLFHRGTGHRDFRNTRWAAYNAVTEFADHHSNFRVTSGKSKDLARMDSVMFGSAKKLKDNALQLLTV